MSDKAERLLYFCLFGVFYAYQIVMTYFIYVDHRPGTGWFTIVPIIAIIVVSYLNRRALKFMITGER